MEFYTCLQILCPQSETISELVHNYLPAACDNPDDGIWFEHIVNVGDSSEDASFITGSAYVIGGTHVNPIIGQGNVKF